MSTRAHSKDGHDYLFRIILLGDVGVGKTSLAQRYVDRIFTENINTVGVEFKVRVVDVDGKTVKLQLQDTNGCEKFQTVPASYYRGSQGCLLVYDIASKESFNAAERWADELDRFAPKELCFTRCFVGHKTDLESKRQVDLDEAKQFAQSRGFLYNECSAKSSDNIDTLFEELFKTIISKLSTSSTTPAEPRLPKKESCCNV